MHSSLVRIFKFAFQNFFRNIWLTIVNITIITLTLLMVNFLIIFNLLAGSAIDLVKDKIDISLYFRENVVEEQISEFREKVLLSDYIKSIEYISSEAALTKFEKKYAGNEDIIGAIEELKQEDEKLFLASLKIKAKDISLYDDILEELSDSQYNNLFDIDEAEFKDYELITQKINTTSQKIEIAGYLVSVLLILMTLMMVYNTIKIAIFTYKEEISIMKLVGATSNFIKIPFFLEILFYNLISILLTILLVYGVLSALQPFINKVFNPYSVNLIAHYNNNFIFIFLLQFIVSSLFSALSSLVAMKKYLKI